MKLKCVLRIFEMQKTIAELGYSDLLTVNNISRNTEQILVRFYQNDLQIGSFQMYTTGQSKMACKNMKGTILQII